MVEKLLEKKSTHKKCRWQNREKFYRKKYSRNNRDIKKNAALFLRGKHILI